MSLINWVDFDEKTDLRGNLVSIDTGGPNPFVIKRVYYLYKVPPGQSRGFHAHKKLRQLLICVAGSCRIILDDGERRDEAILNSPARGLVIESRVWREMSDFSTGTVLLVLASEPYDEGDYIRDYASFLKDVSHG